MGLASRYYVNIIVNETTRMYGCLNRHPLVIICRHWGRGYQSCNICAPVINLSAIPLPQLKASNVRSQCDVLENKPKPVNLKPTLKHTFCNYCCRECFPLHRVETLRRIFWIKLSYFVVRLIRDIDLNALCICDENSFYIFSRIRVLGKYIRV